MQHALDRLDRSKTWALLPYLMVAAAELKATRGDRDGAKALLDRAAALVELTNEQWCQPELLRVRAACCRDDSDRRVALLRVALQLAVGQEANCGSCGSRATWPLRCAIGASPGRAKRCWRRISGFRRGRSYRSGRPPPRCSPRGTEAVRG